MVQVLLSSMGSLCQQRVWPSLALFSQQTSGWPTEWKFHYHKGGTLAHYATFSVCHLRPWSARNLSWSYVSPLILRASGTVHSRLVSEYWSGRFFSCSGIGLWRIFSRWSQALALGWGRCRGLSKWFGHTRDGHFRFYVCSSCRTWAFRRFATFTTVVK